MKIHLAHKIALDPNNKQATYFAKGCGTARFAYNWALQEWNAQYEAGGKPSAFALEKQLNEIKDEKYPWMREVVASASARAVQALGRAYKNFFEGHAERPSFKRKGVHDSFRVDNGTNRKHPQAIRVDGKRIQIPRLGWVRMRESQRFEGRIIQAVVSHTADRWYVSLTVEVDHTPPVRENQAPVGVDLGILTLATLSDGTKQDNLRPLRKRLKQLKRLSRAHSRKQKGSANRKKSARKLARLHARVADARKDTLHKATTELVRNHADLVLEDLNVSGMMANHCLARSVADTGLFEYRRQVTYKAVLHGCRFMVAPRFYPSSKLCSACGHKLAELPLKVRKWTCPACGAAHDRDENAGKNLAKLAVGPTVAVCGGEGADGVGNHPVKPAPLKQKLLFALESE